MPTIDQIPKKLRHLVVFKDGKPYSILNAELIKKQKVDKAGIEMIKYLHGMRSRIYDLMEAVTDEDQLKRLFRLATDVEFLLQDAWKFERNIFMHPWYKVPKCTCPKMDNKDPFYYGGGKVIVGDCPWHWPHKKENTHE